MDTVKLRVRVENGLAHPIISALEGRADTIRYSSGAKSITGYYNGIHIKAYDNFIFIQLSLSRYYYGSNIKSLTLKQTIEAFGRLSDDLNIDLNIATLQRIDIADTLVVKNPPEFYYGLLENLDGFNREMRSGSLYFQNNTKRRVLVIYNKGQEIKDNKKSLQPELIGKYLLRFEVRFLNNFIYEYSVKKHKKRSLRVKDFCTEEVFKDFIDMWLSMYTKIDKTYLIQFDPIKVNSFKSVKDMFALDSIGIRGGTQAAIDMVVRVMKENKKNTPYKISKIKRAIRDLAKKSSCLKANPLIEELDYIMYESYKAQLNGLK